VLEAGGTAGASAFGSRWRQTGTAQNTGGPDHGWFVGFAPDSPRSSSLFYSNSDCRLARRIASAIIGHYLKIGH
jgi:hypothetical protein